MNVNGGINKDTTYPNIQQAIRKCQDLAVGLQPRFVLDRTGGDFVMHESYVATMWLYPGLVDAVVAEGHGPTPSAAMAALDNNIATEWR